MFHRTIFIAAVLACSAALAASADPASPGAAGMPAGPVFLLPAFPALAAAAPSQATEILAQVARAPSISPVDTMQMSHLERLFWGRGGLMRRVGLFSLDESSPRNDFRQMAKVRRRMLSLHQTLGLATIASMAVTVYGGQRAIDGHGSGLHKASLPFTIGLYSTTAALALASPPKLIPSRGGMDTISFHKLFAAVHLTGMVLTPMLAPGGGGQSARRRHQISGYTTFGAFTGGMMVVTFFH